MHYRSCLRLPISDQQQDTPLSALGYGKRATKAHALRQPTCVAAGSRISGDQASRPTSGDDGGAASCTAYGVYVGRQLDVDVGAAAADGQRSTALGAHQPAAGSLQAQHAGVLEDRHHKTGPTVFVANDGRVHVQISRTFTRSGLLLRPGSRERAYPPAQ